MVTRKEFITASTAFAVSLERLFVAKAKLGNSAGTDPGGTECGERQTPRDYGIIPT